MKAFLKKVVLIVFVLFCVSFVFTGVAYWQKDRILNYRIPADKHIVLMGNSQLEMGVDDSDIDGVVNLAKSAKQYLFMRIDLENLIERNSQIDTVFLIVSPFSVRESDADRSYFDESYISSSSYYAPFLTKDDWRVLPVKLPFVKDLLSGECLKFIPMHQTCGKFLKNFRNDMEADQKKEAREKKSAQENNKQFEPGNAITLDQLDRIGNLCIEHKIKLIFISTPGWKAAEKYDVPHLTRQVNELQAKYDADYWDYICYEMPDSCFSDMTHLHYTGAKIFTKVFKERLGR